MSIKACKRKSKRVKENLKEIYELILEDGIYHIVATECDDYGNHISKEIVCLNTKYKRKAMKIYSLLVKNNACACTIKDIIIDQMC